MDELDELRELIDLKNEEILKSFQERLKLVLKIFELKKEKGLKIKDKDRENQILKNVLNKSIKRFKAYDYFLFLNILNLSRLLQYEKFCNVKNINEIYPFVDESLYYKNLNVVSFGVDKKFFSLEQFKKYNVKSAKTLKEAFNSILDNLGDILIYKVKKPNLAEIKMLRRNKSYLNCIINFRGSIYFIASKKIYLDKGNIYICLDLSIKKENFNFLNILTILFLNKANIKKMYVSEKGKENLDIFLNIKINYKNSRQLIDLINMLKVESNLEWISCYRKMKIDF